MERMIQHSLKQLAYARLLRMQVVQIQARMVCRSDVKALKIKIMIESGVLAKVSLATKRDNLWRHLDGATTTTRSSPARWGEVHSTDPESSCPGPTRAA